MSFDDLPLRVSQLKLSNTPPPLLSPSTTETSAILDHQPPSDMSDKDKKNHTINYLKMMNVKLVSPFGLHVLKDGVPQLNPEVVPTQYLNSVITELGEAICIGKHLETWISQFDSKLDDEEHSQIQQTLFAIGKVIEDSKNLIEKFNGVNIASCRLGQLFQLTKDVNEIVGRLVDIDKKFGEFIKKLN